MTKSRTGPTNRVGALGVVVAALGLLLGMAFVSPAGAQDDDPYTGVLGLDLEQCPDPVPGLTLVSGEVAPGENFVVGGGGYAANAPINLYVCSTPIKVGTGTADASGAFQAPGSIPADLEAGAHDLFSYGMGADGEPLLLGLQFDVEGTPSTPNPPSNPNPPSTPGTTGGTPGTTGGTPGTTGGTPGTTGGSTGTPSGVTSGSPSPSAAIGTPAGTPGAGGPLATTGFGAALPSLLATALVVGGGLLMITVARRRRSN
jgi:hypothetical protein